MCNRKGFSAGKPKSFTESLDLNLSLKPRHHSYHRYHTPVPGDYQIRTCSSWAVIIHFGIRGAWAAEPPEQFANLPRDLRISACARHSLRHGKVISPANHQLHRTPPSLKTSPLANLGFVLLGYHWKQKIPWSRSSPIQLLMHAYSLKSSPTSFISGKCSFYPTNPNPNFCYKIGNFAWQFACPVVSVYLHRIRKYWDLGYYTPEATFPMFRTAKTFRGALFS